MTSASLMEVAFLSSAAPEAMSAAKSSIFESVTSRSPASFWIFASSASFEDVAVLISKPDDP